MPTRSRAASSWRSFEQAFERWADLVRVSGRISREASIDTYRDLWQPLAQWCVLQRPPLSPATLTAADLQRYIASRKGQGGGRPGQALSSRYIWRLLHLVDRVLPHAPSMPKALPAPASRPAAKATSADTANGTPAKPGQSSPPTPALPRAGFTLASRAAPAAELLASREDWLYANASHRDPLPEHLSAAQARMLVLHLSQKLGTPGRRGSDFTWQDLRNRAAVALHLGAGLTPGELRLLTPGAVIAHGGAAPGLPWKLRVPGDGPTPEHDTPLARWAGRVLRAWIDARVSLGIPGDRLFPSTLGGKPWGKVAHYNAVGAVLYAAGLEPEALRGGSFRLRHTFALRQLRRGRSSDEVAHWLGLVDPSAMRRYERVLLSPVAVSPAEPAA